MKTRIFVVILSIIVIAGFLIYFLIPSPIRISGGTGFESSTNAAYRALIKQENWDKLSPGNFNISKRLLNTVELNVKAKDTEVPVQLLLIPMRNDSVNVEWNASFPVVKNPISKITQYSQAIDTRDKINSALLNFRSFISDIENVYGIRIQETSTIDTFLIATRFKTGSFPSQEQIYAQIAKLRSFATSNDARETGFPMLNISTIDSTVFSNMVALPVNKILEGKDSVFFVRMVPGKFLTTEVKGGTYTIQFAHRMMDQYFKDYNRMSMAIPFEYLVTDRLKEKDTTKWVTKIYGPVY